MKTRLVALCGASRSPLTPEVTVLCPGWLPQHPKCDHTAFSRKSLCAARWQKCPSLFVIPRPRLDRPPHRLRQHWPQAPSTSKPRSFFVVKRETHLSCVLKAPQRGRRRQDVHQDFMVWTKMAASPVLPKGAMSLFAHVLQDAMAPSKFLAPVPPAGVCFIWVLTVSAEGSPSVPLPQAPHFCVSSPASSLREHRMVRCLLRHAEGAHSFRGPGFKGDDVYSGSRSTSITGKGWWVCI